MESYSLGVQRSILGPESRRVIIVNTTFCSLLTVFSMSLGTLRRSMIFGVPFLYLRLVPNLDNVNSRVVIIITIISPQCFFINVHGFPRKVLLVAETTLRWVVLTWLPMCILVVYLSCPLCPILIVVVSL